MADAIPAHRAATAARRGGSHVIKQSDKPKAADKMADKALPMAAKSDSVPAPAPKTGE